MLQEAADEKTLPYQAMMGIRTIICKNIYKLTYFYFKERNNTTTQLTFRCKILFATLTNSDKSRNPSKFSS